MFETSYFTGIVVPVTTSGASGANPVSTVEPVGVNVSATGMLASTLRPCIARYCILTSRELVETSGNPAAAKIVAGSNRAHGVVAKRFAGFPLMNSEYVVSAGIHSQSGAIVIQAS